MRPQAIDRDRFRELIQEGKTVRQIAEEVGCHPDTARRLRRELQGPAPLRRSPRPLTPHELDRIERCLDEGWSIKEIAETYGHNHRTIARHFPGRSMPREECHALSVAARTTNRKLRSLRGNPDHTAWPRAI